MDYWGGGGQRVCWPPSQIIGGAWPPWPPPPLPTPMTLCATGINIIYATGKNINPRFRFKIKASYIESTEGDVRRVTVLAVEAT